MGMLVVERRHEGINKMSAPSPIYVIGIISVNYNFQGNVFHFVSFGFSGSYMHLSSPIVDDVHAVEG